MEWASKNILLNVQSVYKECTIRIESHESLIPYLKEQEWKKDLLIDIDNILNNILINLADNYPQAPASGGTPRMKEVINEVNRLDDE